MRSIFSMFAKSPFKPLASHIEKVKQCIDQMKPLFQALESSDYPRALEISELIVKLEHDADTIKDEIRTHLPQSFFLPVDKRDFMHLLSAQDDISDAVEDLAVLVRIKQMPVPQEILAPLRNLVDHVVITAHLSCDIILELDDLLEASFAGTVADKVEKMAQALGVNEWEADQKQLKVAQALFALGDKISPADLLLWNEINKKLSGIADKAELIGKILRIFISQ